MSIEELISELEKHPKETEVLIDNGEGVVSLDEVSLEVGLFWRRKVVLR